MVFSIVLDASLVEPPEVDEPSDEPPSDEPVDPPSVDPLVDPPVVASSAGQPPIDRSSLSVPPSYRAKRNTNEISARTDLIPNVTASINHIGGRLSSLAPDFASSIDDGQGGSRYSRNEEFEAFEDTFSRPAEPFIYIAEEADTARHAIDGITGIGDSVVLGAAAGGCCGDLLWKACSFVRTDVLVASVTVGPTGVDVSKAGDQIFEADVQGSVGADLIIVAGAGFRVVRLSPSEENVEGRAGPGLLQVRGALGGLREAIQVAGRPFLLCARKVDVERE